MTKDARMKVRISLCQIDIQLGQTDVNLQKASNFISQASKEQSHLILLPELWESGYDLANAFTYASAPGSGTFVEIAELARRNHIAVGGSTLENFDGKIFNTFTLYSSEGELIATYRKIYLFRPNDEDKYLAAGEQFSIANTAFGKAGLAICYDLRFPELFRRLAIMGAQFFLLPAEWPIQRSEHWRTLLRARAIENQISLAAVNRVGISPEGRYGGCSALIDAWGETVIEADAQEGLFTGEIDLSQTARIKRKFDILVDQRPDLYQI
jgi:omega-amidase